MPTPATPVQNQGQERVLMFLLIVVLTFFLLWIYQPPIMYGCCWLLYQLWTLCDFPKTHSYVAVRLNILAWAGSQVDGMTWTVFIEVMNKTAGILLVPLSATAIGGMISVRNHPRNRTRRQIDVLTLPHIMSKFSPSIIPALCYGDQKTQLLNCDPAEHRSAQSPEEFALEHHLVIGDRLDRERASTVFRQQLGTPLIDANSFNAHERALVAVFGLADFLKDRKSAEKLLDDLNRSCLVKSRRDKGEKGYPVLRLANKAFEQVITLPAAGTWMKQHGTTRSALSALHDRDLRLPGARFRWLKGLDRTLWYALTSTGRPKAFIEGAGVIAVAKWETLIADVSLRLRTAITLPESCMDKAIDGLENDLRNVGKVMAEHQPSTSECDEEQTDEEATDEPVVILKSHHSVAPQPHEAPTGKQPPLKPHSSTKPRPPGRAAFIPRAR